MSIPYPTFRKVEEQADQGVPVAQLLMAAIVLLNDTAAYSEKEDQAIYREIVEQAKDEFPEASL